MITEIQVSIICNTYNHEKYIRRALDGFIMQETEFPFEVLIHDDASTDRTAEIIREYEAKHTDIIKPIYETENQYSQHNGMISKLQYGRVQGKYIAICEGDDYWIDPLKLQKQYVAMEEHPETDICVHRALIVDEQGEKVLKHIAPQNYSGIIPAEEVILGEGGFVATNSIFYRASLDDVIPDFRRFLMMDYTLQIHGSLRGGMLYLNDCMSAYRYMAIGSWTRTMAKDLRKWQSFYKKKQTMLDILDKDTGGRYKETILHRKRKNTFDELQKEGKNREILRGEYSDIFSELSFLEKVKVLVKVFFPWTYKLRRWLIKV